MYGPTRTKISTEWRLGYLRAIILSSVSLLLACENEGLQTVDGGTAVTTTVPLVELVAGSAEVASEHFRGRVRLGPLGGPASSNTISGRVNTPVEHK